MLNIVPFVNVTTADPGRFSASNPIANTPLWLYTVKLVAVL